MKKYTLYQVDAFTKEKFRGNPAGVVSNADGLTEVQMQQIAREMNCSETAFIFKPDSSDHSQKDAFADVHIRFFTPKSEVPTCGHATVSAHYIRAIENNLTSCTVMQKIGIGILPVEIIKEENDYKIWMTQGQPTFSEPFSKRYEDEITSAVGLTLSELNRKCPVQIVSTGHSKVMIGINSRRVLNSLVPDFFKLAEISKRIKCNGYYVFTLDLDDPEILAHGRMFAPAIGINEDPVTGNANGPLGAYLIEHKIVNFQQGKFHFKAKQGESMGREGIIEVEVDVKNGVPGTVRIGGNAVVVFKTEITV
jgi:PhzF family phenazine biosynthesis protein